MSDLRRERASQPPTLHDTLPSNLSWFAGTVLAVGVAFLVGTGWWLQYRIGNAEQADPPGITQINLPKAACPRPAAGQVLIITVFAQDAQPPALAKCQIVAGRTA